jgi:hypothetical protein
MNNPKPGQPASFEEKCAFFERQFSSRFLLGFVEPTTLDLAYLEEHGKIYPPPCSIGLPLEEGSAYKKCADVLDIYRGLKYVQGFVCSKVERIIIPHAWCSDLVGKCIEVTWDLETIPEDVEYFGVAFNRKDLLKLLERFGTHEWYAGFADLLQASTDGE